MLACAPRLRGTDSSHGAGGAERWGSPWASAERRRSRDRYDPRARLLQWARTRADQDSAERAPGERALPGDRRPPRVESEGGGDPHAAHPRWPAGVGRHDPRPRVAALADELLAVLSNLEAAVGAGRGSLPHAAPAAPFLDEHPSEPRSPAALPGQARRLEKCADPAAGLRALDPAGRRDSEHACNQRRKS